MELDVLGCSGGRPGPGLACSGYLLTAVNTRIWIDTGTGTLPELLLRHNLHDIDAIWISHMHADHCSDLLGVFHALAYGQPRTSRLPVYGPPGWADAIRPLVDEPGGAAEVFEVNELTDGLTAEHGSIQLTAVEVPHSIQSFAMRATAGGKTFAYSSDCGSDPAVTTVARDSDLFVCEAYVVGETEQKFTSVKSPEAAGRHATEAAARRLLLTHLPPDADPESARKRAATAYDGPIEVARQGEVYQVR